MHALLIQGEREPMHVHTWRVVVTVAGEQLDDDGLLCDFHAIEARLDEIILPFRDANLHDAPPFDEVNPTAERVAEHIAESIARALPPGVILKSAAITEAPGCVATYYPTS